MSQDKATFWNVLSIVGALAFLAVIFYFAAENFSGEQTESEYTAAMHELVDENIRPAGQVNVAGETSQGQMEKTEAVAVPVMAGPRSGETVYNTACMTCHNTGVAGAPKLGDKAAWAPRIANGIDSLIKNATNGLNAMPPKGLCMDCSTDELKAAIEHIVAASQ